MLFEMSILFLSINYLPLADFNDDYDMIDELESRPKPIECHSKNRAQMITNVKNKKL